MPSMPMRIVMIAGTTRYTSLSKPPGTPLGSPVAV